MGFQEGKPVNQFFICTKLDPREFEDVPKSVVHVGPLVFGCKNLVKGDINTQFKITIISL